jgi:hypothetical protein
VRKLFVLFLFCSLGFAVGCGSSSGSTPVGVPTGGSNNTLSIVVDGGPTANQSGGSIYENGVFASAQICKPGTSTCVTVDHLLVDTGSFGLRVLQSEVSSLNLPNVNASNGSAAFDCAAFVDGSFLFGPVQGATVTLAGEVATNMPIEVISTTTNVPTSCSNGGVNENTQSSLGANGILGVGLEPIDCGAACDPNGGLASPPSTAPAYFTCSSSSCTPAFVSESNQVTNPVVLFSVDNNGVIVELPNVSGSAATVTGSLVFGIGTESNNGLASGVNVFTLACDDFNTSFQGQNFDIDPSSCSGPGSFIDSGSNALYFPDVNNFIPLCPTSTPVGNLSGFYCPASLMNLSAVNEDPNTSFTETTDFSVDNALNLFTNSSTANDAAYSTLGGPQPSGAGFDWGLPFFYGKTVYSAIDGQSVPSGLAAPPWWAY